jgi:hypothetical protein
MKTFLLLLGLWSAGCGVYWGIIVEHNQRALQIGFSLAFLILFVDVVLAVSELPRFIRKRNKRK